MLFFPSWCRCDTDIQKYSQHMVFPITDPIIGATLLVAACTVHAEVGRAIQTLKKERRLADGGVGEGYSSKWRGTMVE